MITIRPLRVDANSMGLPFPLAGVPNCRTECPGDGLVDRLAFQGVRDSAKDHQEEDRNEADDQKAQPIRGEAVLLLDFRQLNGEIAGHEADWEEQNGCLGQENCCSCELLNGLGFFESDQVEILRLRQRMQLCAGAVRE